MDDILVCRDLLGQEDMHQSLIVIGIPSLSYRVIVTVLPLFNVGQSVEYFVQLVAAEGNPFFGWQPFIFFG